LQEKKLMTMPTLFVSHGAPTLVIDQVPTHDFLIKLGKDLPRPRAILCISAHWESFMPQLSGTPNPSTIYDFGGFPPEPQVSPAWPAGRRIC
jgi:4,5-DOPA dioxygenase extradiol